ncbi:MAG: hypothetical protein WBD48_00610 [Pseudolabrys sp.]
MADFRELRTRQTWQVAERRSMLPTVLGVIAAFAVGGLLVVGWNRMPAPAQWLPFLSNETADSPPAFSGNRVGRAETAPMLNRCVTKDMFGISGDAPMQSAILWQALSTGSTMSRVASLFGQSNHDGEAELVTRWAEVADCVYRQNRVNFCDIDNRALAVEAANSFLRLSGPVGAKRSASADARAIVQTRRRVVDELKVLVANGELIASDFGALAPPAVRGALAVTKTVANGCARK